MKSKNTNNNYGNGSIFYVESRQRYAGSVILNINGNKKRKTVYGKTKREVRNKLLELQIQAQSGELMEKDCTTIYQLANAIIDEQLALNEIKQNSYDRKVETLKKLEPIYNTKLQEVTEELIKKFFISQMYYSQSSINKVYQLLNATLNEAKRKGIISENPMSSFKRPKSKQEHIKVRSLTIDEQKDLLRTLKTESIIHGEQMLMSMFTGMRMGEINALDVSDIDFSNRVINVFKTVSRGTYGQAVINRGTKTQAGMRKLPMSDEVTEFLKHYIGKRKEGLLFSNKGKIITTAQVNSSYARTLAKYEIINPNIYGKVDLHSLRHTYATRLIESGCPPKVLQKLLGHTDISITLNTYCDAFDSYVESNLEVIDRYFRTMKLTIN